jgi:Fe(3+) dicitrate transport protein
MEFHRTAFVASHVFEVPEWGLTVRTQVYRQDLDRTWNKFNRFAGVHPFEVLRDPATYSEQLGLLRGDLEGGGGAQALLIGPNARKHFSQGVQSILSARAKSGPIRHRLEAGVRLHRDGVARRHTEDGYLIVDGQLFQDGTATDLLQLNTATANALALHVADAMTWRRLTLTPGARIELIDLNANNLQNGEASSRRVHSVLPGVSAFYGLTNTFGVLAGVHRGFSPPTPHVPNPGEALPGSESSVNYETGVRHASRRARAEVIGFYNDYSNITGTCSQARGCITDNVDRQFDGGRARIYGLEAYAGHEVPVGRVRLPFSAAYTFTRSAFQTNFDSDNPVWGSVSKGDSVPYIPEHQLNTTLGLETGRAGGMVGVTYVAPMREQAGSGPLAQDLATDQQLWVDVEGHVRVVGRLALYANIRNLFNAENIVARRPFGARVNPPRWVQVGAKVAF